MPIAVYPNIGHRIRQYPLADGAEFTEGAAVVLTTGEVDECGADPALILGFALHDAGADPDPSAILVALADANATFIMQGTSAPALTDVGVQYGIAKHADGQWIVDKTDVVAVRVIVEKVYLDREQFEVRVLPANRQLEVAA